MDCISSVPGWYSSAGPSEDSIVRACLKWLKAMPNSHGRKVFQNGYQRGEPDIDGCMNGRAIKVEVKRPGGTPTQNQSANLAKWAKAGAVTGTVCSVDELKTLLREAGMLSA